MTKILRKAGAVWNGDVKNGNGVITTESKALYGEPYTLKMRFDPEERSGTNPEELIAAAHAACFSMALASTFKKEGYDPEEVETTATITLMAENGNNEIAAMNLHVRAFVPGLDKDAFDKMITKADANCPVSNLLRCGLDINFETELLEAAPAH
jgi:osmotically inducible protein OsmC